MNEVGKYNEQVLVNYLIETEKACPRLLELLYPITFIAIDYLSVFDEDLELDEEYLMLDSMNINDTISLVKEFLNKYFPEYIENFDKSLNNGVFDIFYKEDMNSVNGRVDEPITIEEKHININIPLNSTIDDGAIILHEFFHYTNSHGSAVREIFTELISIYIEIRYYEFLVEKGYPIKNYYNEIYNRLKCTYNSANNISYSGSILDTYYNTGEISDDSIKFIDKDRDLYSDNIESLIMNYQTENIEELIYDFQYDVSYLFGGIIAFNLINDTVINDIKIKYINKSIDKLTINDILSIFELDLNNLQGLVDNCKKIFDTLGSDSHEKSYMYRRTNRNW